jgi:uncharacterized membrane protein
MFAIDELFGLPAHPLVVHLPVLLVPITAVGVVWCTFSARWRARLGWIVVGSAALTVAAVELALNTGEALEERVRETELVEDHAELADAMLPLAIAVLVVALGGMLLERWRDRRPAAPGWVRPALAAVAVAAVLSAGAATVQIVRIGHSGARSVWHDTPTEQVRR